MDPFLSLICLWPLDWAPYQWQTCAGQKIMVSENMALYALIGTMYGGDSAQTYFNLPDFRGRIPVGYGQAPGLSPYPLATKGGSEKVPLSTSQLPSHNHQAIQELSITIKASSSAGTQSSPGVGGASTLAASTNGRDPGSAIYNGSNPDTTLNIGGNGISGKGVTIGNTGENLAHENRQPFLAVNFIMAMQGIFPPRP